MTDLGFAIDGLYASGWWPAESDRCALSQDGRWYPEELLILEQLNAAYIDLMLTESTISSAVEVEWVSPHRGRQSVHGRSKGEALILAYTHFYQESHPELSRN